MTRKNEAGQAPRLCKRFLFLWFRRLVDRLRSITEALSSAEADGEYADGEYTGVKTAYSPSASAKYANAEYAHVKRLNQPYASVLGCKVKAFQWAEPGEEADRGRLGGHVPLTLLLHAVLGPGSGTGEHPGRVGHVPSGPLRATAVRPGSVTSPRLSRLVRHAVASFQA